MPHDLLRRSRGSGAAGQLGAQTDVRGLNCGPGEGWSRGRVIAPVGLLKSDDYYSRVMPIKNHQ
jgi:hypothetical protein